MRRDKARLQLLALLLLGGLGLVCLDLDPIRAAVADYLHGMPETETVEGPDAPRLPAPGLSGRAPVLATAVEGGAGGMAPTGAQPMPEATPERPQASRIDRFYVAHRVARKRMPRLRSLADAQRRLDLTLGQSAGLERIASDARRDLDDLRYVRNDRGQSWHGVVADVRLIPALEEAQRIAETLERLTRFVDTELSGRGETYRQTHRRLLDGCRELTGRLLTPAQQRTLAGLDSDPVFDDAPHAHALHGRKDRIARLGTLFESAGCLEATRQRVASS